MASPLCRGSSVLLTPFLAINGVCERASRPRIPLTDRRPRAPYFAPKSIARCANERRQIAQRRDAARCTSPRGSRAGGFFCEVARAIALTNRYPRDNLVELPRRAFPPPQ
jgi:hypothetical protein